MIRRIFGRSFRLKLFGAFFLSATIPLLLCSLLMSQIFLTRLEREISQQNQDYLEGLDEQLENEEAALRESARTICSSSLVKSALQGNSVRSVQINNILFDSTRDIPISAGYDLYNAEGTCLFSTRNGAVGTQANPSWGSLKCASSGDGLVFSATEDVSDTSDPLYRAACRIADRNDKTIGYYVANIYQSGFREYLEGKYGTRNTLLLLSTYYRPVYCAQPSLAVSLTPLLRNSVLHGTSLDSLEQDFHYMISSSPRCGLYAVIRSPVVLTSQTLHLLQTVTLLTLLLSILVSALLAIRFSGQVYEPIDRLHGAMQQVSRDNLDVHIDPVQDDELGELTERFNQMTSALKRNREELLENQKELNEAQIRMLQAQLNPHFLSNTLDTMKWISKINQVPQLATMAVDLADILRFGISPAEFVTLDSELNVLDRYIEIQKIRLSDKFLFQLEVPDELRSCIIPKMILQPLVENSILHGINDRDGGTIVLEIRQKQNGDKADMERFSDSAPVLVISVTDNGVGFPAEMTGSYRKPENTGGHHLGLYNVDTILKKHYGSRFGLFLSNETDPSGQVIGAVITAELPLRYERPGQ